MTLPPPPPPTTGLPLTGERTVPDVPHENYWFQRHVIAYRYAASMATGLRVVDAGCGEGYGTAMLGRRASDAIGVELVPEVVEHARRRYPQVTFLQADVCDTGLADAGVDLVVNLQVIEHLPDVARFLAETRRILSRGGHFVVTTPNRLTFTPHSHEPTNIFHVEEFSPPELVERLRDVGGFGIERVLGLHHGRRIRRLEQVAGQALPDLVLQDPQAWPAWLHTATGRLTADDFVWSTEGLDQSLDLLAVCRA